ncbi:MAG: hypothetical protein REI96_09790 [Flavobacterium nitrogenifigens]|uniref:hypothetical protein n=1 Tax=Flavobacterium nitrogenifigens TaxID=1617283 RepID=UPI00280712B6|nr:hypothetical protein [Flavobacterium nitrogenifigens]MDQ8012727.1 hypothetical protein [Flavobacterium nitrogenifigens]
MNKIIIYSAFIISTSILLLDKYSEIDINNPKLYYSLLIISTSFFISILNIFSNKKYQKIKTIVTIINIIVIFALYHTFSNFWKTQTIEYQNIENTNKTIDFEMKDIGALGYNRRLIEKTKILPGIDLVKEIDTNKIDLKKWKKVVIDVNELNLKY